MTTDADPRRSRRSWGRLNVVSCWPCLARGDRAPCSGKAPLYRQDIRFCSTIGIAVMIAGRYVLSA
jgi:hypothetical protein